MQSSRLINSGWRTYLDFGVLFSQFPSVLVQSSVEVTWTLWRKTTKRGIGLFSLSAPDAEALHQYTLAGGRGAKGQGGWESEKPTHTRTFTRALHGQSTPSHSRTNCDELLLLHVEYREQHLAVTPRYPASGYQQCARMHKMHISRVPYG